MSMVQQAVEIGAPLHAVYEQLATFENYPRFMTGVQRVTRIGDLMRRTSIDELPQLWNVLCGQMSLVGPRPIVADEVNKYREVYETYSTVKPGITGLWQVSGRSQLTYGERVKLDEFYVQHWSFWLDIYILGKTFVALITRHGAC